MEFQLEVLEILKVMLLKCYIQYASKCGKCSSGHRTGNWKKSVFIPIPKNAMPKNVSTTIQLRSFYMPENTQNLSSEVSAVYELRTSRCITWVLKSQRKVKVKVKSLSRVQLFATPWTVAYQPPPSMGFSRQECWSGLPFHSPGDLPNQESNSGLPHCRQALYCLSHQGSQSQRKRRSNC